MTEETPPPSGSVRSSNLFASRWFIASAGFVAALVVMGLVATTVHLVGGDSGGHASQAQPSEEPHEPQEGQIGAEEYPEDPTTAADPGGDGNQSACGLSAGDATDFTAWPGDTTWETVGTMQAPISETHGPAEVEDSGYRHCYAKSPAGAVIAAANFVPMGADPLIVPDLLKHMYAEGPGKQAVLEQLEAEGPGGDKGVRARIGGADLISYGADRARVDVALIYEAPESATVSTTVDLLWEKGDWKIVTREDGTMIIPQVTLPSLDGYALTPQQHGE